MSSAAEVYRERYARFAGERDAVARRMGHLANVRLLAFLAALGCVVAAVWLRTAWLAAVALVFLVGFVLLVREYNRLGRDRRRADLLREINEEAGDRLRRDWDALPLRHALRADADHPYARDLDVYGRASLLQLVETIGTRMGEETLAHWLSAPAPPEEVLRRQEAVAELAPLIDLRDELTLGGRLLGEPKPDPEPFLAWAEGGRWLERHARLLWLSRLSPAVLWPLLLLDLSGVWDNRLWLIPFFLNLALSSTFGRSAYAILDRVYGREGPFLQYASLLRLLRGASFRAPALRRLQEELGGGSGPADERMRSLHRGTSWIVPPSSVLYVFAQGLAMWDFHVLAALERWQAQSGDRARGWLNALGQAEALAALAVLRHDQPDWAFPALDPAADRLEAKGLGHPLLPGDVRVTNDVEVGPAGSFLLVTGSNMSGKSTLLRAIGTNAVLAGAGGPVCAESMRLPPVRLWTSMRVEDSLERGQSYFFAEILRLKAVVDAARQDSARDGTRLLYLLDEILQGTNTFERQVAARRVIGYLVERGAIGAVSTHDLTLADTPEMRAAARMIHFAETIERGEHGPVMRFDYSARSGIATSSNALRLMEIVGLDVGEGAAGLEGRP